jgi:large subunit ribosomal protein L2
MSIKFYNPVTSSMRGLKLVDKSSLHKGAPMKLLVSGMSQKSGRNNTGKITVRHKSGGHKKKYRIIDFKRSKFDIGAVVVRNPEYDPNRSSFISLIKYDDGVFSYIITPNGLKEGDRVISSFDKEIDIKIGNAMPLKAMPLGTIIHNLEDSHGKGGSIARSAGSYCQLVGKDSGKAIVKMRSGEIKLFSLLCIATIGSVSNSDNKNTFLAKAGRSRWLGIRPTVRGVAMNPIDHPHGGGEGKTSGGRHPVSPYGKSCKGKKTRSKKKASSKLIIKKRK